MTETSLENNKDGGLVAASVDAHSLEPSRRTREYFDALCQRIESGFSNVPEAVGVAEIEAAIELERARARLSAERQ